MLGTVLQVNVSRGGIPKRPTLLGELTTAGVTGDAWRFPFHGGMRKAILLVTTEGIDELCSQGFPLFPGALGENLTTRGLDRHALRPGHRLPVGNAVIELTTIRTPCATLDVYGAELRGRIFDERVEQGDTQSPRWGLSGVYARVIEGGLIRPGDPVSLAEQDV